jgi:hypothetical protein
LFSEACRFLNRLFTPSSHLDLTPRSGEAESSPGAAWDGSRAPRVGRGGAFPWEVGRGRARALRIGCGGAHALKVRQDGARTLEVGQGGILSRGPGGGTDPAPLGSDDAVAAL